MVDVQQMIPIVPLKDLDKSSSNSRDSAGVGYDAVDSDRGHATSGNQDSGRGRGLPDSVTYQESLKQENRRLQTFRNSSWPTFDEWPMGHLVTPQRLAAAGLYYTGIGDTVRCAFCLHALSRWESTDDPWSEHSRLYPECSFRGGTSAGNMPIQQMLPARPQAASASGSDPVRPDLHDIRARIATFGQLSQAAQHNFPPIETVAEAGFYFAEEAGGSAICFWCGGTLRCWSSGEDPWMEHVRWFPECDFVKKVKGPDYVVSVQLLFSEAEQPRGLYYSSSEVAQAQVPAYDIAPGVERLAEATPLQMSPSVVAQAAFDLLSAYGVSREAIHAVARRLGLQRLNSTEPLSHEELRAMVPIDSNRGQSEMQSPAPEAPAPSLSALTEGENVISQASDPENLESMETEQPGSTSADPLICRVCLTEQRQRAFVPCGHFVACEACALSTLQCPTCSCSVRGTYRVYLP